jgi:N-methylhydantoinase A/oxoprolinase/acetone carboxylase beta subunit
MAEVNRMQVEEVQPLLHTAEELSADARPLRALFEDLALVVRERLQQQGVTEPVLDAALDLQYVGRAPVLTVPFPLEIESAAVCLADPLPLDAQAVRQAVDAFHLAYAERYGHALRNEVVQVVMLRVRGRDPNGVADR